MFEGIVSFLSVGVKGMSGGRNVYVFTFHLLWSLDLKVGILQFHLRSVLWFSIVGTFKCPQ